MFPNPPVLEREDELSASHGAWGAAGLERNLTAGEEAAVPSCPHRASQPRQSPGYQASVPNIPKATAPGAGTGRGRCRPWPWDGAGRVCPTQGFCCEQPCDSPTAARPPSPHLRHPPAPLCPSWPGPPSWSISKQGEESQRAHSCEEGVSQLCQLQLARPGLGAPQDKSVAPGHTGVILRKQLPAEEGQQDPAWQPL